MAREIKFRFVLADEEGKIHYLFKTLEEIEKYGVYMITPPSNYTVKDRNLYTGLGDKNGKEIYEGDIVDSPKQNLVPVTRWLIVWAEDKLGFEATGKSVSGKWWSPIYTSMEVIGNVYKGEAK